MYVHTRSVHTYRSRYRLFYPCGTFPYPPVAPLSVATPGIERDIDVTSLTTPPPDLPPGPAKLGATVPSIARSTLDSFPLSLRSFLSPTFASSFSFPRSLSPIVWQFVSRFVSGYVVLVGWLVVTVGVAGCTGSLFLLAYC